MFRWEAYEMFICLHLSGLQKHTRQQTTTVDYKRLINGLVLGDGFSLWQKKRTSYDRKETI